MAQQDKCCSGDGARTDTTCNIAVNPSSLTEMSELFKALGDPRRLAIVRAIKAEPGICACVLLTMFEIAQPTLSHHMRILCDSGMVTTYRQGKWAHYNLSPAATKALQAFAEWLGSEE